MGIEFIGTKTDEPLINHEFVSLSFDELLRGAEGFLVEMGLSDATLDFVYRAGELVVGSGRVPLRVAAGSDTYVIKSYDKYDPKLEKEIIKTIEGEIGPGLIFLGKHMYAEEYIDPEEYDSLEEIANSRSIGEFDDVIVEGAKVYAELARMLINYDHRHWLDEFHKRDDGKIVVTDFGTSHFFYTEEDEITGEELLAFRKKISSCYSKGDLFGLEQVNTSFELASSRLQFSKYLRYFRDAEKENFCMAELCDMVKSRSEDHDPVLMANIVDVMVKAQAGIRQYFSCRFGDERHARIYEGVFFNAFLDAYFQ